MMKDIEEVLVPRGQIREMVKRLGAHIRGLRGKGPCPCGSAERRFYIFGRPDEEITIPVDMDFIAVSSYGASTKSSGVVRIIKDIDLDVVGKHVLIVEDLVDTGLTLRHLKDLSIRGAKSVKICTAFDKPSEEGGDRDKYNGIEVRTNL